VKFLHFGGTAVAQHFRKGIIAINDLAVCGGLVNAGQITLKKCSVASLAIDEPRLCIEFFFLHFFLFNSLGYSGRKTGEVAFQNIVIRAFMHDIYRKFLGDGSCDQDKSSIRSFFFQEFEGVEGIELR